MLEPGQRLLYLEELRPPEGYQLDRAIATTYSLDLLSLLMAPLSMVLYESQSKDEIIKDPLAALEAIKRTSGRIGLFCQKGRISVPKNQQLLYSYLEDAVVQVEPPGKEGVFHSKIWLIRFVAEGKPAIYRFLCLSRNLTFDRSWDTALLLEGELANRQNAFSRNHPLGDFIKALPGLAAEKVPDKINEHVAIMEYEVRRVQFEVDYPFNDVGDQESLAFRPIGIPGYQRAPKIGSARTTLIVAPFLKDRWIEHEMPKSGEITLISRSEELNAVSDNAYEMLEKAGASVYVMDESSEPAEDPDDLTTEKNSTADIDTSNADESGELSGLHAKLFVSERNSRDVRWWTGSANATMAAFEGHNVEFLVGLKGSGSKIGVSRLLGEDNTSEDGQTVGAASLFDLLQPYRRPSSPQTEDSTQAKLKEKIDIARNTICSTPMSVKAVADDSGKYTLLLGTESQLTLDTTVKVSCAPISMRKHGLKSISPLIAGENITFQKLPATNLTCFVAFEVTARLESQSMSTSFVLKLDSEGFPEDRNQQILRAIISDTGFLKYLLYLLTENDPLSEQKMLSALNKSGNGASAEGQYSFGMPLFEELVKTFSRQPRVIDHISERIAELKECDADAKIIPDDFLYFWETFTTARKMMGEHGSKHKKA